MIKDNKKITTLIFCSLIMMTTAASDSLRGIFLPEFRRTFDLTASQSSLIIMASYIGNLLFLLLGGHISDKMPRKRFIGWMIIIWIIALGIHVFTENYYILFMTIMFTMGASTMISTSVNILTPLIFASPALFVSAFNFLQGIGITLTQNIGGKYAENIRSWHIANLMMLSSAVICFILIMTLDFPETEKSEKKISYKALILNPATWILIIICGCYFVAEHGLMNWLTSYGSQYLGFTISRSAMYLSLFFGGITLGRLIFAPLIEKIGVFRSLLIWSSVGVMLYSAGIALGRQGIILLSASGIAFSIIYPMLVMLIGKFYDPGIVGSATGFVLSIGTLFDIFFNAFFGKLVENVGYGKAIIVLPVSAVFLCVMLYILKFCLKKSKGIS